MGRVDLVLEPPGVLACGQPDQLRAVVVGEQAGAASTRRDEARLGAKLDPLLPTRTDPDGRDRRVAVGLDIGQQLVRQRGKPSRGARRVEPRAGALPRRRLGGGRLGGKHRAEHLRVARAP